MSLFLFSLHNFLDGGTLTCDQTKSLRKPTIRLNLVLNINFFFFTRFSEYPRDTGQGKKHLLKYLPHFLKIDSPW